MPDRASHGEAAAFNTVFNQTLASQDYSNHVLGPCVIGWAGQIALWGMVVGWAVQYAHSELFQHDAPRRRWLLGAVVAICTVQAGFNFALLYHWTTTQGRAAENLVHPTVLDAIQPLSVSLLGPLVQAFLARRAIGLLLSPVTKWLAGIFFAVVISCEFVAAVFNIVISLMFHANELGGTLLRLATYNLATGIWLWFAAIADVGVTVLLCVVLNRRIAGFSSTTDGKLRRLCWLAVQSASYTAILAVGGALAAYAAPADDLLVSSIPYAFWYLLPSCYPLALLTALSSRLILRGQHSQPTDPSYGYGIGGGLSVSPAGGAIELTATKTQRGRDKFAHTHSHIRTKLERGHSQSGIQVDKHISVRIDADDDYSSAQRGAVSGYGMRSSVPDVKVQLPEPGADDDLESGRSVKLTELADAPRSKEAWHDR
ncbi:hypothetical protein JCM10213v2_006009 [Rhodosporidiobolus nylandii]